MEKFNTVTPGEQSLSTPPGGVVTFSRLFEEWPWRPLRNCPGRFILAGPCIPLEDLVGTEREVRVYSVKTARDTVLVARLDSGGIISYQRPDGSCLHTLNTEAGFYRKLQQLGIVWD